MPYLETVLLHLFGDLKQSIGSTLANTSFLKSECSMAVHVHFIHLSALCLISNNVPHLAKFCRFGRTITKICPLCLGSFSIWQSFKQRKSG